MAVKKTSRKSRGKPTPPPKRVAAAKPMSDTHRQLLSLVAKGMLAVENATKTARQAEKQMEQAYARAQQAAQEAKKAAQRVSKKTAKTISRARKTTAKQALANARTQAKRTKSLWSDLRKGLREEEKALAAAVRAAEVERKREAAKQEAVNAFVAQWEQEHKKRQVKRKTGGTRKKVAKKKAAKKKSVKKATA